MFVPWLTELGALEAVPPFVLAAMFFGLDVMFLLFGWQIYRISLVVLAVLVGGAIGAGIAHLVKCPALIFALPVGIVLGLLAGRLEKVGAFLMGGLCSAVWLLSSPAFSGERSGLYIASGLAFLITGILAVLIWRPMIIAGMALIGSWLLLNALLSGTETFSPGTLRGFLSQHPWWGFACMALITLIGIVFQSRESGKMPQEK